MINLNENLVKKLFEIGVFKFGNFKLKTGIESPYYIDLRIITSYPEILNQIINIMSTTFKFEALNDIDHVCGVPYAGISYATLLSKIYKKSLLILRKEQKDYGTKKILEGNYNKNDSILLIEDVITTGTSLIQTIDTLEKENLNIKKIIVIIDRQQQGIKKVNNKYPHIEIVCIWKISDILEICNNNNLINLEDYTKCQKFIGIEKDKNSNTSPSLLDYSGDTPLDFLHIKNQKQTGLVVSLDKKYADNIFDIIYKLGTLVSGFKFHFDIIKDWDIIDYQHLKFLAKKHNFFVIDDRKYADIGNITSQQIWKSIEENNFVPDLITMHGICGQGAVDAVSSLVTEKNLKLKILLIAQLSCNNLINVPYTQCVIDLARKNTEIVAGFICQERFKLKENFLYFTPGISIDSNKDNFGQNYKNPEHIKNQNIDFAIVGRSIIDSENIVEKTEKFKSYI